MLCKVHALICPRSKVTLRPRGQGIGSRGESNTAAPLRRLLFGPQNLKVGVESTELEG